jgi:hypothetical protein
VAEVKTNVIEVSGFSIRVSKETLLIARFVGMGLGFLTESNKPFIRFGVTGPILKSTTEVTWAGRESKSPSQRAPVADTVKRGGGGGKVIQTNAGRRMMLSQGYTGLSTRHTSLLSLITCIKILRLRLRN